MLLPGELLQAEGQAVLLGEGFAAPKPGSRVQCFRTGDLGVVTQHGLEIGGRADLQIKINGDWLLQKLQK